MKQNIPWNIHLNNKVQSEHMLENLSLTKEMRTFEFRKEAFEIVYHYYVDLKHNEQFTTTELDRLNLVQIHNQYRSKYGIPFIDEIKSIRASYGISASKMSEILGLGTNVYRSYENGEMPSVVTGRLIQLIKDPEEFKKLLELSRNEFKTSEMDRIFKSINVSMKDKYHFDDIIYSAIDTKPSVTNGYKSPKLNRIGNMVKFFASEAKPFKTQLYYLLFYSDFLHYKRYGYGISGISYFPVDNNPFPRHFGSIYDFLYEKKFIDLKIVIDEHHHAGEQLRNHDGQPQLDGLFDITEIQIMNDVVNRLSDKTFMYNQRGDMISILEHSSNNQTTEISYNKAFELVDNL